MAAKAESHPALASSSGTTRVAELLVMALIVMPVFPTVIAADRSPSCALQLSTGESLPADDHVSAVRIYRLPRDGRPARSPLRCLLL